MMEGVSSSLLQGLAAAGEVADGISSSLVQGLTAVGLLVLILLSLITALRKGWIYVRPQVDEIKELQKARADDAKQREAEWRAVAEKWQQTAQEAIGNNEANLEQGRTVIALLESVRTWQRSPRR